MHIYVQRWGGVPELIKKVSAVAEYGYGYDDITTNVVNGISKLL